MYDIEITRNFSAAHHLVDYPGPCARLHGHNYKVAVTVRSNELDKLGMALDFKVLKSRTDAVLDTLDHQCLNELECFQELNPTSENLARVIFEKVAASLLDRPEIKLVSVQLWESDGSSVKYVP